MPPKRRWERTTKQAWCDVLGTIDQSGASRLPHAPMFHHLPGHDEEPDRSQSQIDGLGPFDECFDETDA
jgi:hypothetical protein